MLACLWLKGDEHPGRRCQEQLSTGTDFAQRVYSTITTMIDSYQFLLHDLFISRPVSAYNRPGLLLMGCRTRVLNKSSQPAIITRICSLGRGTKNSN